MNGTTFFPRTKGSPTVKYCRNCNDVGAPDDEFCANCGSPFVEIDAGGPPIPRDPFEVVRFCLRKYCVFRGRASRSEFWFWASTLFAFNALVLLTPEFVAVNGTIISDSVDPNVEAFAAAYRAFHMIVNLVVFLPGLAVLVRRLRDQNISAWFYFSFVIGCGALFFLGARFVDREYADFIKSIGSDLILGSCLVGTTGGFSFFVQLCLAGTPGPNKFGPRRADKIAIDSFAERRRPAPSNAGRKARRRAVEKNSAFFLTFAAASGIINTGVENLRLAKIGPFLLTASNPVFIIFLSPDKDSRNLRKSER